MAAERLVVDASVAAKWFLEDEEGVLVAEELLSAAVAGASEMHAPELFVYEIASLLLSASRRRPPRLHAERGSAFVRRAFTLPVDLHAPSQDDCAEAFSMASRFSKSFYDMTYLQLAEKLDCKWCTADERAAASTHPDFPADRIVLLSELAPE